MLGPEMPASTQSRFASLTLATLAALVGAATCGATNDSAESSQARSQLAAVRARLMELTHQLSDELSQRDTLSARLRQSELTITEQRRQLEDLQAAAAATERRRSQLRAEQAHDRAALQTERGALAAQARSAYMIGRQEHLKLLLNQTSPARLGRTLAYYAYFAAARRDKLTRINADIARAQQRAVEIDEQSARLKSLESAATLQLAALQNARVERSAALAALDLQVRSGKEQLHRLELQERAVESLVADLSRMLQDFPTDPAQGFDSMRGRLPWPVAGRVSARYSEARGAGTGVRWNGVMIDAARGARVRATYFGRVVYADWLQGLGLLLIVSHSGGYMTLYGHAEVLYKAVGDRVVPGDVIGALSDVDPAPQLYFEIREGRKTVDPLTWLRRAP
jgi:septal ring factor EnvC (AmiA/AmiB activator)